MSYVPNDGVNIALLQFLDCVSVGMLSLQEITVREWRSGGARRSGAALWWRSALWRLFHLDGSGSDVKKEIGILIPVVGIRYRY
jgi:hypothetical protein